MQYAKDNSMQDELQTMRNKSSCSGGSKGGTRDTHPPRGPNSFIFMQFSAEKIG